MKRTGRTAASLMATALLIAACGGSGGSKTLSEDDFIDELNSICKSADRAISRLDFEDRGFFDDVLEEMQNASDELADLKPPADLENDYNDFADNLEDTIKATEDLRDAVDDEDQDATADASDDLTNLGEDADDIADDLGAEDCIGVGNVGGGTDDTTPDTTEDTTEDTTDDTTENTTDDTTEETTANTPLEIDPTIPTTPATSATTPPTQSTVTPSTATEMTAPGGGSGDGLATEIDGAWAPPSGWTWIENDESESITPYGSPILAPILTGYWVGIAEDSATGQRAFVAISEISGIWTQEQAQALLDFEVGSNTSDTTTPSDLVATVKYGVNDGEFDVGVVLLDSNSVYVLMLAGGDVLGTLDAIYLANSMGG